MLLATAGVRQLQQQLALGRQQHRAAALCPCLLHQQVVVVVLLLLSLVLSTPKEVGPVQLLQLQRLLKAARALLQPLA